MGGQAGRPPPKVGSKLSFTPKAGGLVSLKVEAGVGGDGAEVGIVSLKAGTGVGGAGARLGGAGAGVRGGVGSISEG
jgi:hypothetical protein